LSEVSRAFVHLALPTLRVNAEQFHQIRLWECESAEIELGALWHRANRRLPTAHATSRVVKEPEEWS
jgi:hypothetical protein